MTSFTEILKQHEELSTRQDKAQQRLKEVRQRFQSEACFKRIEPKITIFCVGSLGRLELGESSDFDFFITADGEDKDFNKLTRYPLFARLIQLNSDLGFQPLSKEGEYLKINFIDELKEFTGSKQDDGQNLFTARMLLLLESKYILNEKVYLRHLEEVIRYYYRDEPEKKHFKPFFLLNDILRYWRTLCLNYEEKRSTKKNLNLKFTRMLTVFATVSAIIIKDSFGQDKLLECCKMTPLGRLAKSLDILDDNSLIEDWHSFLDIYAEFLVWKEAYVKNNKIKPLEEEKAKSFKGFLYNVLTYKKIYSEYKQYLIV